MRGAKGLVDGGKNIFLPKHVDGEYHFFALGHGLVAQELDCGKNVWVGMCVRVREKERA